MTLRTIIKVLALVAAVLMVPPAACILLMSYNSATRYDRNSADYRYVASIARDKAQGRKLDLKRINGGDWQFVCVIGAYNDPVKILREQADRRGVAVAAVDPVEKQFLGLSPVEENENAISFVDDAGRGRTMLVDGFEALAGQHARKCFGRDAGEIGLPVSEIEP